jgi:putative ABC transport system ATP-binding protein
MDKVIELKNITKIYDTGAVKVPALVDVSLNIYKGEFVAIMGPSGSGKSTLMNIISCMDKPTKGEYFLNEKDVSKLSKDELAVIRNKTVGIVFQSFNLLSRTNALENVELPLLYDPACEYSKRHDRAMAALGEVGLKDWWHHYPNQLSGGQQQRVAVARAMVNNPKFILADEPTGNLDSRTSVEIMELLQELNDSRGITIIIVTHESDISKYAKRILSFTDGKLIEDIMVAKRLIARKELKKKKIEKKKV